MKRVPDYLALTIIGLALTFATAMWARSSAASQDKMRLEAAADAVTRDVEGALATYIALLRSADGMIRARGLPDAAAFRRYTQTLSLEDSYAGVQGLGFALDLGRRAPQPAIEAAGFSARAWPSRPGERTSAIVLLEPLDERNKAAMGFDMMSEARRRTAMLAAETTGEPSITLPIRLVQEIGEDVQPGFLIYLPTRAPSGRLIGWTYSPFRSYDFFGAALASTTDEIAVEIVDTASANTRLFRSDNWGPSRLQTSRNIITAGARWTIVVRAADGFFEGSRRLEWVLIALIGVSATAGLAGFMRWRAIVEQRLEAALTRAERAKAANEILLQEVNHRVANSLTLVSALLSLQQRSMASQEAREALQEAATRISAVARVHHDLYLSHGPNAVSADRFLGTLVTGLHQQLLSGSDRIAIKTDLQPVELSASRAIPLGIVTTELATNAIKYAFPGDRSGIITVSLRNEGERVRLAIVDDGVGIGDSVKGTGLGTKIIDAMATQLDAVLTRSSDVQGTRVELTFPKAYPE